MRCSRIGLAIAFLASAPAMAQAPSAENSPLGRAVQQRQARVLNSARIGAIESGDARAEITGLAVANASLSEPEIRGIRFDFSIPGWKESVYLDEQQLHLLKEAMDKLAADVARRAPQLSNSRGEGYIGVCDMANQLDRFPITVDYRVSWYPALVLRTPALMILPDRTPSDLSAILSAAIDYLQGDR